MRNQHLILTQEGHIRTQILICPVVWISCLVRTHQHNATRLSCSPYPSGPPSGPKSPIKCPINSILTFNRISSSFINLTFQFMFFLYAPNLFSPLVNGKNISPKVIKLSGSTKQETFEKYSEFLHKPLMTTIYRGQVFPDPFENYDLFNTAGCQKE